MVLKRLKSKETIITEHDNLHTTHSDLPVSYMIPASRLAAHQPHEGPRPHATSPTQKWRVVCAGFPPVTLGGLDHSDLWDMFSQYPSDTLGIPNSEN